MNIRYTIQDYQQIKTLYVLPDSVLSIISVISTKFGTTQLVESKPKRQHRISNDKSWKSDFKPTIILEKVNKINEIRISLNKLSVKNYDTTSNCIVEKIKELDCEDIKIFMKTLMDVISTNKIFSSLYANFYKKIIDEFPELFSHTLDSITTNYIESISLIHWIDEKDSYDEFCKNNKENDKRKTIAAFIINLYYNQLIPIEKILFIINLLLENVLELIKKDNKIYEVEEITENIYVLLTQSKNISLNISLYEKILELSEKKAKEDPSISSRAIFKYIDIIEQKIKKNIR